jgi:FO synthase
VLAQIVAAGINDWGGVSPLTPDFVNPEAPWPHLDELARETGRAGKFLHERLTVYPRFVRDLSTWVDAGLHDAVLAHCDAEGLARSDDWCPGALTAPPQALLDAIHASPRPDFARPAGDPRPGRFRQRPRRSGDHPAVRRPRR